MLPRTLCYVVDRPYVVLGLITGCAAFLRIFYLGTRSLWLDEALLFWFANGDLNHVLEQNALYNSAPPAFPLLISAALTIDASEVGLRALSCFAGIAAVPVVYFLAREFVSHGWAGFAALAAAVAPTQIEYSQQVREYSLTFLLAATMLLAFCQLIRRQNWSSCVAVAAIVVVSLFTQYGLALLFAALNLVFLLVLFRTDRRGRLVILWSVVLLPAAAAAVAVYELSLKQHFVVGGRGSYYLDLGYWDYSVRSLFRMAVLNTEEIISFAFPTALALLICALGVSQVLQTDRRWTALWLLIVPFGVVFAAAMVRAYPYLGARQTIFLTPMVYVFMALGMTFLARQTRNQLIVATVAVLVIGYGLRHSASYFVSHNPQNIRPIVGEVVKSVRPEDRVYVHSGAAPAFSYYVRSHSLSWIEGVNKNEESRRFEEQLESALADRSRLWLVFSHIQEDELNRLVSHIGCRRQIELIRREQGAWLYLAL